MSEMTEIPVSLATLRAGQRLRGLVPEQTVTLIAFGPTAAERFGVFFGYGFEETWEIPVRLSRVQVRKYRSIDKAADFPVGDSPCSSDQTTKVSRTFCGQRCLRWRSLRAGPQCLGVCKLDARCLLRLCFEIVIVETGVGVAQDLGEMSDTTGN